MSPALFERLRAQAAEEGLTVSLVQRSRASNILKAWYQPVEISSRKLSVEVRLRLLLEDELEYDLELRCGRRLVLGERLNALRLLREGELRVYREVEGEGVRLEVVLAQRSADALDFEWNLVLLRKEETRRVVSLALDGPDPGVPAELELERLSPCFNPGRRASSPQESEREPEKPPKKIEDLSFGENSEGRVNLDEHSFSKVDPISRPEPLSRDQFISREILYFREEVILGTKEDGGEQIREEPRDIPQETPFDEEALLSVLRRQFCPEVGRSEEEEKVLLDDLLYGRSSTRIQGPARARLPEFAETTVERLAR